MRRPIDRALVKDFFEKISPNYDGDRVFLCIDSRVVEPGDIFIAIKGEIKDGHDFIEQALKRGAQFIVAEEHYKNQLIKDGQIIWVKDSLAWFSHIAHRHLQELNLTKVAITGSNGKTTTKEMVKAVLAHALGDDVVYASSGNKNNHFGVPLSALEVTTHHKIAIFEMGMNHAKEIAALCKIVEPDIGIITNIGHAHEGNFCDGIDGVAQAKGELFASLATKNGLALLNMDDERIVALKTQHRLTQFITFGFSHKADICLISCDTFEKNSHLKQNIKLRVNGEFMSYTIPLLGLHNALNSAAALAVAHSQNLPLLSASLGFEHMTKTQGRFLVHDTHAGFSLIDDGYNANPTSMAAGIKAALHLKSTRRIAVIGAMGELGVNSKEHHQNLGKLLAQHFDFLFLCGDDTKYCIEGALDEGFKKDNIFYKDQSTLIIEPLKQLAKPGDVIFVKGSLSANMKAVVDALLTEEG